MGWVGGSMVCCSITSSSSEATTQGFKLEFKDWGSGFRDWGSGFRDWGSGFRDWGSGFRDWGLGFRDWGSEAQRPRPGKDVERAQNPPPTHTHHPQHTHLPNQLHQA